MPQLHTINVVVDAYVPEEAQEMVAERLQMLGIVLSIGLRSEA